MAQGLTHDLGSCGCSDDDGQVGCDKGHPGLHILIDAVLRGIQLQRHVAGLLQPLQLLLRQLLPARWMAPALLSAPAAWCPAQAPQLCVGTPVCSFRAIKSYQPRSRGTGESQFSASTTPAGLGPCPALSGELGLGRWAAQHPLAYVPLGGGGGDTDDHDGGVGQDLLQVLIVLALVQAVAQLLSREGRESGPRNSGRSWLLLSTQSESLLGKTGKLQSTHTELLLPLTSPQGFTQSISFVCLLG